MEVYVIETMGGQIVNGEYSKEICPKFLESAVKTISTNWDIASINQANMNVLYIPIKNQPNMPLNGR